MNRFKKELRKIGVTLECDFEFLPYPVTGGVVVDSVIINTEECTVTTVYNTIVLIDYYDRSLNIVKQGYR